MTGVCITVDGEVVAWFSELNDAVEDWCAEHYFGRWLIAPAEAAPRLRGFTIEELALIKKLAADIAGRMRPPKLAD